MPQQGSDSPESYASSTTSVLITRQTGQDDVVSELDLDYETWPDVWRPKSGGSDTGSQYSPVVAHVGGEWDAAKSIPALRLTLDPDGPLHAALDTNSDFHSSERNSKDGLRAKSRLPFHKWVRSLHRRRVERQRITDIRGASTSSQEPALNHEIVPCAQHGRHQRSSSDSSFAFVAAARSASVSLASASIIGHSRRNTLRSSGARSRTDRSSRASVPGGRLSEDSHFGERSLCIDPVVTERSLQRRRILEELINTEEGYIGDIRFLANVSSARTLYGCKGLPNWQDRST